MVCQEAALLTKVNLIPMASLITVLIQTFPQRKISNAYQVLMIWIYLLQIVV